MPATNDIDARIRHLDEELQRQKQRRTESYEDALHELIVSSAEIKLNLAHQDKATAAQNAALFGNGKPGLMTRMDRVERRNAFVGKVCWVVFGAVVSAVALGLIGAGLGLVKLHLP